MPKLGAGKVSDWEYLGICSSPTVEAKRVYVVSNRCEVLCLDAEGLGNGNDGPFQDEAKYMAGEGKPPIVPGGTDADILWVFDMRAELGVFPHNIASSSVVIAGDRLFATTSNGQDWSHLNIPSPFAPCLVALDKNTGALLGEEASGISQNLLHCNWSSPGFGKVNGREMVFFGAGDGFVYAFDPKPIAGEDGFMELREIWKYDGVPEKYRHKDGKPIKYPHADGPSEIISTPVFYKDRVYVAIGQDPEHGEGKGMLSCIDASGKGDISQSGAVWTYDKIHRTISTASIDPETDLLFLCDYSGFLYCLDANTEYLYQMLSEVIRAGATTINIADTVGYAILHPEDLRLLETLDIFAVRAEYMARFREHVEAEGVSVADRIDLPLPIRTNRRFLRAGLVVPRPRKSRDTAAEHDIVLEPDASVQAWLDRSPQVQSLTSDSSGIRSEEADAGTDREIPAASLDLVDWEAAWLNLLSFREHEGLRNLAVPRDAPRAIMATTEPHRLYRLGAESSVVEPASLGDREELQDAVEQLLRNYTLRFHRARSERWDSDNLELRPLTEKDANFRDYTVRVAADQRELAVEIERLIQNADALYRRDTGGLPRLHFDRHLYQPLLLQRDEHLVSDPPGLNEGERRFVSDLRVFWELRRDELPEGAALFLLRNLDRGRGVGFFERRGFYPDFILWVKRREEQRIVFIEPHGMVHAGAYRNDEKARLHLFLADLSEKLRRLAPRKRKVTLDSFIVSETPFEELRLRYDDGSWDRQRFEDAHILFPRGPRDYLRPILALPRRADSAAPDLAD